MFILEVSIYVIQLVCLVMHLIGLICIAILPQPFNSQHTNIRNLYKKNPCPTQ
uniref:Uncharacterized protein n=1 Tax=Anguilla anguilla TaxID=7936 RepID=A0A0E9UJ81_ANGAN